MERPIVLVAEDRPRVLALMATVLEPAHDVLTASEGAAALSLIGSRPIDVVLTDVRMPGASGFDLLRAVQARSRRTQVVMMTAFASVPDAVAAIKLGAYDYVAKPIDADEIALVVARAVDHVRRGDDAARDASVREDPAGEDAARGAPAPAGLRDGERVVSVGFHHAVEDARARASREYLTHLMRLYGGNVTQAATRAGMTRESLHRVLRKYGVRAEHPAAMQGGASDDRTGGASSSVAR